MKRIPSSFQMGPHIYTVRVLPKKQLVEAVAKCGVEGAESVNGLCDYETYTIYIRKVDRRFPKQLQMHTFWHEYFHALFDAIGRERLAHDETLVDNCGSMHLQALNTTEF